jgi:hypothetical protein
MELCTESVSLWVIFLHRRYRDYIASNGRMIDDMERIWKKFVVTYFKELSLRLPGGLRKTAGNLSQNCRCPGRDSKLVLPE